MFIDDSGNFCSFFNTLLMPIVFLFVTRFGTRGTVGTSATGDGLTRGAPLFGGVVASLLLTIDGSGVFSASCVDGYRLNDCHFLEMLAICLDGVLMPSLSLIFGENQVTDDGILPNLFLC